MLIKIVLLICINYSICSIEEDVETFASIERTFDTTILSLQHIYYDDDSSACSIQGREISKNVADLLKREWCFRIERSIYSAFRKLHNSFDVLKHNKAELENFLQHMKTVDNIMNGIEEDNDVKQRKLALITFIGNANEWRRKMKSYLTDKNLI